MNVAFYYSSSIDPIQGGVQRVTMFLGEYLRVQGFNIYYLSAKKTSEIENTNQYYFPTSNVRSSNENKEFFSMFLDRKEIDIVINQAGISPYHQEVINWTKEKGVKLITFLHSPLFDIYGLSNHFHLLGNICNILNPNIRNGLNKILNKIFKIKYQHYYKNIGLKSDAILMHSKHFFEGFSYFSGIELASEKLKAVPNPVTIKVDNFTEQTESILFVGRFEREKNIDLLLKIWNKVAKDNPSWKLILVGDGKEKQKIEKQAFKMNLKRIHFEGYQNPEEYYKKASIFCMTSAYEGFGLVLVEAMAHKVVPIAFKSYPNIVDIIEDEENGYLVSPFDIDEYAYKLSNLIRYKERRDLMAEKGLKSSKQFDIEMIAKEWIALFNSVLNKCNDK